MPGGLWVRGCVPVTASAVRPAGRSRNRPTGTSEYDSSAGGGVVTAMTSSAGVTLPRRSPTRPVARPTVT